MKIEMQKVESSQINGYGYDADTRTLAVEFKNGGTYHYENVGPDMFAELNKAPSKGGFIYKHIKPYKDIYPFKRVSGPVAVGHQDAASCTAEPSVQDQDTSVSP